MTILLFHPEPERVRRPRDPVLALRDVEDDSKMNGEDDPDNDDHFWPPSPKRPRVDEDSLLAEAVLAYAANVGDADDAPSTYQQAMKSDEASEWLKATESELKAQSHGLWFNGRLAPDRSVVDVASLRSVTRTAESSDARHDWLR